MIRQILPISALLLGSFFLLFAGGVNGLILPVRGAAEGFSSFSLGLLGTGWALGYVSGCVMTARLVARVGHIRAFSVMASFAAIAVLAQLWFIDPEAWIVLRGAQGFCFAGAAMIVESWLSERSPPRWRGRIFALYTMVNLFGMTVGQMTLTLGDIMGFQFFVLAAMFYSLALVPTAMTSTTTPKPLVSVHLDLRALWRNSPVAVFAVFMVGVSNAAFGALAAVYAAGIGMPVPSIALFTSLPILAGAVAQIPVGILSDRIDRRRVLVGVAAIALASDGAFLILAPQAILPNLVLASLIGAAIYSMYPVIVAHANDKGVESSIQISGGLLLIFGLGSIVGPLVAGYAMSGTQASGLFAVTGAAHVLLIAQALYRIGKRAAPAPELKGDFRFSVNSRNITPEAIAMSAPQREYDEATEAADEPEPAEVDSAPGPRSDSSA